jgi:hypothetical protein
MQAIFYGTDTGISWHRLLRRTLGLWVTIINKIN